MREPRWLSFAIALLLAFPALASEPSRYALLIGDNEGDPGDEQLRYAEQDARRLGDILRDLGGVPPENVLVLADVQADDLRRALISINARLRNDADHALLFVFYSGHGDAESLHLRNTHFPLGELRDLLAGSPAATRVLVVDACRSGGLTRVKGGHPGPSFDVQIDNRLNAEGLALITSSAAGEDAQESDQLGASIFTHFLASALIGAGDADGDGAVTLDEAFAYASERTLAATSETLAGPQHPTYRMDLGGRGELVLTWPGRAERRQGHLRFPYPGTYLVRRGGPSGAVVAEVLTDPAAGQGAAALALPVGTYFVSQRARDHLLQASYAVAEGEAHDVQVEKMQRVDYAQVVRKGGTERKIAWSVFAAGGARGELFDLGIAGDAEVGGRLDLSQLSVELRGAYGNSFAESARLGIRTQEFAGAVDAQRVFDLGPLSLGVGIEVALEGLSQNYHDQPQTPNGGGVGMSVGPLVVIQVPLWEGLHLRVEGAAPTYLVPQGNPPAESSLATPITYRVALGLGWYL